MKKIVAESFKRPITKEQGKDTGMAMVLLLLLFSGAFKGETLVTIAIVALIVDMTFPQLYRPVAVLWLGLSHLLGHSGLQNHFNAGFLYRSDPRLAWRRNFWGLIR